MEVAQKNIELHLIHFTLQLQEITFLKTLHYLHFTILLVIYYLCDKDKWFIYCMSILI